MNVKDTLTFLTLPSPAAGGRSEMTATQPSPSLQGSRVTGPHLEMTSPAHGHARIVISSEQQDRVLDELKLPGPCAKHAPVVRQE